MTIQERLRIIGQAFRGKQDVKEVTKEVIKKIEEKSISGSTVDLFTRKTGLSDDTRVSSKTLAANKGWVYKNTDVIAKEVSSIEFELYKTRIVQGEVVYDRIWQNPLLDALDRFNEFTTASDGFYTTEAHRLLSGDSFWFVDGAGTNIRGMYLLPPDKITLNLGDVAGTQRVIESYEYVDTINGETITQIYRPEDIIHFRIPNPSNPYRGLGKVEVAAEDIDLDTFGIAANRSLFMRGMISDFMLTTEKSLTPEQRKQLQAELTQAYGGLDNMNKTMILSGGLEPKSVQMTNKDMQFDLLSTWVRDKIMSIWGNTRPVLGITDDVNRSNAESTILNWKQTTVRTEMKQITDTLNEFLVPRFGESLILGFCDPVKEDDTQDITNTKSLIEANIITPNEARARLGMDPLVDETSDARREPSQPTQLIPEIPKSLRYVNTKAVFRRNGIYKQVEQYQAVSKAARPIAEKIIKSRKKTSSVEPRLHNKLTNEQVWRYYEKQIRVVEAAEEIFHSKVERFIQRLVEKALGNVPEEISKIQNKALFNEQDEIIAATIDFEPILMEVVRAAGTEALNLVDDPKPYLPTDIRKTIRKSVEKFAKSMIETDKDKIINIIATGVADGLSVPEIRNTIVNTFADYSKMQAERITRTEVARASVQASLDAWSQSDLVGGKQWLTAPGADEECLEYEGQVIAVRGNFYDTSEFADGDPPIHPNCRCQVLPILEGEMSLDTSEHREIKELKDQATDLEAKIDKRTKDYRKLKERNLELEQYVKELEGLVDEELKNIEAEG